MAWRLLKHSFTITLFLAATAVVAGALYLRVGGYKTLSVQTGSMTPAIGEGDLVAVKASPTYEVGDVITYINPANQQQTITHRITQKRVSSMSTSYITKGDANELADPAVSKRSIVGKVEHKLPYAGYAADFVRKPLGLILLIYIPALGIMMGELKRLAAYFKSQARYVMVGYESRLTVNNLRPRRVIMISRLAPLVLLVPLVVSLKTYAAFTSSASVTGTTISTTPLAVPAQQQPAQNPQPCKLNTDTEMDKANNRLGDPAACQESQDRVSRRQRSNR